MESQEEMAAFGAIPFDIFALEHWDYSAETRTDQQQWNRLVRSYLTLAPKERLHYHSSAFSVEDGFGTPDGDLVAPERTSRVLLPFQTAQERRISLRLKAPNCDNPVWLRLCYDPALEARYAELESRSVIGAPPSGVDRDMVLDNADLYNLGSNPGRDAILEMVTRRIPAIADTIIGSVIEDYEGYELSEDADEEPLELASEMTVMLLCVVDDAAVEEGLVKLFWLDSHGRCVWSNKIDPPDLQPMRGTFLGGYSLAEAVDTYLAHGNEDGCGVYQQRHAS